MPASYSYTYRKTYLAVYLVLLALSLWLIYRRNWQVRYTTDSFWLEVTGHIDRWTGAWKAYMDLREQNRRLQSENARLYRRLAEEPPARATGFDVQTARVVSGNFYGRNQFIIIDKGTLHGIHVHDGVWSPEGVVGIVAHTSPHFAKVRLLTHPGVSVSVKPAHTGEYGFTQARPPHRTYVEVTDLPAETVVGIHDTVVTSGLSWIFPEGLPVGTVVRINRPDPDQKLLGVRLFHNPSSLRYVYVGSNGKRDELNRLAHEK